MIARVQLRNREGLGCNKLYRRELGPNTLQLPKKSFKLLSVLEDEYSFIEVHKIIYKLKSLVVVLVVKNYLLNLITPPSFISFLTFSFYCYIRFLLTLNFQFVHKKSPVTIYRLTGLD